MNGIFKNIIFLLCLLITGGAKSFAQNDNRDILLMFGEASRRSIQVQWQPTNIDNWDSLNTIGYRLERVELDNSDQELTNTNTVLANSQMPKDLLWFEENGAELDGLIGAMGALMYDTVFQFPENKLLDATEMRYNFLLYEAQWKPLAAEALGLIWIDTDFVVGKKYRYKVSATLNDGTVLSNSLDFTAGETSRNRNPEGLYPKYDFPTRMSLSMMIAMQTNKRTDRVIAQARPYEDSIVIRWAPNSPEFWLDANDSGYYVIRQEEGEGATGKRDTIAHVLPWAKEDLNESIMGDDMALVAANNLHGNNTKNFEGDFIEKGRVFESRYGFAVYAAERSSLAADILGLRLVDKNVEKDKRYRYRITCPGANNILATARLSLQNTYTPQPPPSELKLIQGDQYILLEWPLSNQSRFSSYILERSDDGGQTFFPMTDKPLVFLETAEFPLEKYSFLDSVKVNYVNFTYRLRGNDSFAETSEAAQVTGMAVDLTPPPQPSILSGKLNETRDTIQLTWGTPPLPDDFAGYKVLFGPSGEGPFEELTDFLPKEVESYIYTGETLDGRQSHYFKIMSVDTAQNAMTSIEFFVPVPDLIPPEPPAKVEGVIEDDGTVHLAWEHSVSEDVEGYFVFFANRLEDEFSLAHEGVITQNYLSYKIQEKFLNEEIYYVVAAKDRQGNRSNLTKPLTVKRPDKVPPQKPNMEAIRVDGAALLVSWKKSISKDVEHYFVYKKPYGEPTDWVLQDSIAGEADPIFKDEHCNLNKFYEYRVQAKDDANLYSEFPLPIKGKVPFNPQIFAIEDFTVSLNKEKTEIEINWSYEPPTLRGWDFPYQFYLFKSNGNNNVESFKLLPNDQFSFTDTDFEQGSLYNYAIKIQFDNGKSGALSSVKSALIR